MPVELHIVRGGVFLETFRLHEGIHTLGSGRGADFVLAEADAPEELCQVELGSDGVVTLRALDEMPLRRFDGLEALEVALSKGYDFADLGDFRFALFQPLRSVRLNLPTSAVPTVRGAQVQAPMTEALALKITAGGAPLVFEIKEPELIIGRDKLSQVIIDHGHVSRRHARLYRTPNAVHIQDLGSENGTFLNNVKLEPGAEWPEGGKVRLSSAADAPTVQLVQLSDLLAEIGIDERVQPLRGNGEKMVHLRARLLRYAELEVSVLLRGETGTGKELAARALAGGRRGPLVVITCGATPETLIDSQIFGSTRGAFTGAVDKPGAMEAAAGGTLFIDELGEMPLLAQVRLLRVLQTREFSRVGETKVRICTARFVFATHRNLPEMVKLDRFREDLLYRIKDGVEIELPALRERREDIPQLVRFFTLEHGGTAAGKKFSDAAMEKLKSYYWRGNVRELKSTVDRALLNHEAAIIEPEMLELMDEVEARRAAKEAQLAPMARLGLGKFSVSQAAFEREVCEKALEAAGGVVARAARSVGEKDSTFRSRLIRLGILPVKGKGGAASALDGPLTPALSPGGGEGAD